jgi:hypothetical protein
MISTMSFEKQATIKSILTMLVGLKNAREELMTFLEWEQFKNEFASDVKNSKFASADFKRTYNFSNVANYQRN